MVRWLDKAMEQLKVNMNPETEFDMLLQERIRQLGQAGAPNDPWEQASIESLLELEVLEDFLGPTDDRDR